MYLLSLANSGLTVAFTYDLTPFISGNSYLAKTLEWFKKCALLSSPNLISLALNSPPKLKPEPLTLTSVSTKVSGTLNSLVEAFLAWS